MAPNKPSPHKQIIAARINRELYYKFFILSEKKGYSMTDLLTQLIEQETREIILSSEHLEKINEEVRLASQGRPPRLSRNKRTS